MPKRKRKWTKPPRVMSCWTFLARSARFRICGRFSLLAIAQILTFRFRRRASLELEVIALRHQLKVLKRRSRPRSRHRRIRQGDRTFWVFLFRIWPECVNMISLIKPVTLVKWHNQGFKLYWTWRSQRRKGRPQLPNGVHELIARMHKDNPLWGAGRIQGELLKLGYKVSPFTIKKHLPKRPDPPSPTWKVFFRNHLDAIAAADSFVVITSTFRLLYGFVILGLHRRRISAFQCHCPSNPRMGARSNTAGFSRKTKSSLPIEGPRFRIWTSVFKEA